MGAHRSAARTRPYTVPHKLILRTRASASTTPRLYYGKRYPRRNHALPRGIRDVADRSRNIYAVRHRPNEAMFPVCVLIKSRNSTARIDAAGKHRATAGRVESGEATARVPEEAVLPTLVIINPRNSAARIDADSVGAGAARRVESGEATARVPDEAVPSRDGGRVGIVPGNGPDRIYADWGSEGTARRVESGEATARVPEEAVLPTLVIINP